MSAKTQCFTCNRTVFRRYMKHQLALHECPETGWSAVVVFCEKHMTHVCDYPGCRKLSDESVETSEGVYHTCFSHLGEYLDDEPNLAQRNGFDAEELYYPALYSN